MGANSEANPLTAFVFPGQGSQRAGMRELVDAHEPGLLELATELLGCDPFAHVDEGTAFAQPAIYCASIACWTALGRPSADLFAGHSLGEIAALVAANAIEPDDGLRLVIARGRATGRAAQEAPASGMMAVIAAEPEALSRLHYDAPVTVANDNSSTQAVLAGPLAKLREVRQRAVAAGLRAILLPVEGAFHTAAMQPAVEEYREALDAIDVRLPRVPVFSSVTAREFRDIRAELANSLTSMVRWREVTTELFARGVRRIVEPGPGNVVSKLMVRQEPRFTTTSPVLG